MKRRNDGATIPRQSCYWLELLGAQINFLSTRCAKRASAYFRQGTKSECQHLAPLPWHPANRTRPHPRLPAVQDLHRPQHNRRVGELYG